VTATALLVLSVVVAAEPAVAAGPADALAGLAFLEGDWVAEPDGQGGSGTFSFARELDGRVIVRRNHAVVPARGGRPGGVHDDLLVLWAESGAVKADYWDNEGHVIRYDVATSPGRAVLTSAPGPGPRFRLVYAEREPGLVDVSFEIAPPGKPDAFAPYLSGRARKATK
jgi:hypothetical protein